VTERSAARKIYIVLSPRSLSYAAPGLQSLLRHSLDSLDIALITDTAEDQEQLEEAAGSFKNTGAHTFRVTKSDDLADLEASTFRGHSNLRAFRHGHPCWRKITDPLLLGSLGEELVILDPDLYFPNPFRFEPTLTDGLLLMWQRPNCLLPPAVVTAAFKGGIPLARHVDIGVAHWRASADLDWLDWMLAKLTGDGLPRVMHVEAIVWAAIAMREGGGYLDPHYWRCWQRPLAKRILRKLGFDAGASLQSEPWRDIKCFHAGGEVKWCLPQLGQRGTPSNYSAHDRPGSILPFVELTSRRYSCEQTCKRLVHSMDVCGILD
jgi:hypothetical protein